MNEENVFQLEERRQERLRRNSKEKIVNGKGLSRVGTLNVSRWARGE